eukprot:CAMPEP_0206179124 /NCGR_PEP_ID=MMETSP1474-20131121/66550_1 /ASSEMBLY_ACC=CAM_ASM_001110 /TAXON_ID=97495 /ORGANISM="Imantonia sp., Strain RCC918" /LENGTH=38 /DNA_ID= /DNA_START= /DNA_END= /DNA_ORIENTATION=
MPTTRSGGSLSEARCSTSTMSPVWKCPARHGSALTRAA